MAEVSPAPETPPGESKAQRDARLRRERRSARLQAEGSSRLSKITSLSGRPAAAEAEMTRTPSSVKSKPATPQENGSARQSSGQAEDPDEVDISNMFQRPPQDQRMESQQEMFRRMLRGPENEGQGEQAEEDPMMRMMQQMMGNMSGMGGEQQSGGPGAGGLPPGFANMFGGGQEEEQQPSSGDYIWRIVHAISSLLLGLYAVTTLSFTGSKLDRSEYVTDPIGPRLFWMFATAEVVLQTTRYYVDRGKLPRGSMIGKIAAFLPEPYAGYLRVLNRYSIIYTTVVSDAMVLVFVLGAFAWWNGLTEA